MYYVSMHCFEGKLIHFPGSYQEALVGSGVQFPKIMFGDVHFVYWKKLLGMEKAKEMYKTHTQRDSCVA